MRDCTGTTKAGEIVINLAWQEFDTLEEVIESLDGEAGVVNAVNRVQRQAALQTNKGSVRGAIGDAEKAGYSTEQIQAAVNGEQVNEEEDPELAAVASTVSEFQTSAADRVMGAPRKARGRTKKAMHEIGEALGDALTDDELWTLTVAQFGEERARTLLPHYNPENGG